MNDLDELAHRLATLGDLLVFDVSDPASVALERLGPASAMPHRSRVHPWLVAAAVAAIIAGLLLQPDARDAIARWIGIGGVSVKEDPNLDAGTPPTSFELPGPGHSVVVVIDDRQILVSTIAARPNDELIDKTVGSSQQAVRLDVNGHPGLWVFGSPHEVLYESLAGDVRVQRAAANTLLWYDGEALYRVEGFDRLSDALAFAEGT